MRRVKQALALALLQHWIHLELKQETLLPPDTIRLLTARIIARITETLERLQLYDPP